MAFWVPIELGALRLRRGEGVALLEAGAMKVESEGDVDAQEWWTGGQTKGPHGCRHCGGSSGCLGGSRTQPFCTRAAQQCSQVIINFYS